MEKCDVCGMEITKEINNIHKEYEEDVCYCAMESEIASLRNKLKEVQDIIQSGIDCLHKQQKDCGWRHLGVEIWLQNAIKKLTSNETKEIKK